MVYGRFCREVGPPTRRPGLLQGGGPEPSHNPRGYIFRPRLHPPLLDVLGPGRRDSDECGGWVLRSEETDLKHFSISARSALRASLVSTPPSAACQHFSLSANQWEQIVRQLRCEGLQGAKGLGEGAQAYPGHLRGYWRVPW